MCGIAGIVNFKQDFMENPANMERKISAMNHIQKHRGPDDDGIYLSKHCALGHVRLKVIDLKTGNQPMSFGGSCIVYNGEIYNMGELKKELVKLGAKFRTKSDTEVLLQGYAYYGIQFLKKCNGVFSFALWDYKLGILYLVRDVAGVKPLFYETHENTLYFASEAKAILQVSEKKHSLTMESLCEVFGLGPAKTYGLGPFSGMKEVKPGHYLRVSIDGIKEIPYFTLEAREHGESYESTVEHVRFLVTDAVKKQMLSDVPIATFLSGGLDSSLVTGIVCEEMKKTGEQLSTYSFDFVDNDKNFQESTFQPSQDCTYAKLASEYYHTNHEILWCDAKVLYEYLYEVVDARDYPGMGDVESSLLYFCRMVAPKHKVVLTGECADEIFGGYPWYYRKELMNQHTFPWTTDAQARVCLLRDEVIDRLPLEEYTYAQYEKTIEEAPVLFGESREMKKHRQMEYLNQKWFMQTLLDRMDRCAMKSGLEARVPFADVRIISYLYNIPWEMKAPRGIIKGLLRDAGKDFLPKEILERKKSPYPKTYDPKYERLVKKAMLALVEKGNAPILEYISPEKVKQFCEKNADYGRPFYGQLMAGPQLLAYYLQVNDWMEKYL